jgi:hypothetical protein
MMSCWLPSHCTIKRWQVHKKILIRFHGTIGSKNEMLAQRHLMQAEGTLQDIKEITEQALRNKKAAGDFCTKCSHWPGGQHGGYPMHILRRGKPDHTQAGKL